MGGTSGGGGGFRLVLTRVSDRVRDCFGAK